MDYKNRIDFLLKKVKFDLTAEERQKFMKDLENFKESLKIFDEFDLTDVSPLRQPFESGENTLREDIPEDDVISLNHGKYILENASNTKDGYILLKKGGKDVQ